MKEFTFVTDMGVGKGEVEAVLLGAQSIRKMYLLLLIGYRQ